MAHSPRRRTRLHRPVPCGFLLLVLLSAGARAAAQQISPAPPSSGPVAQGHIVAIQGRVEHAEASRVTWTPAVVQQPLFVSDGVRTRTSSRTAILFIDETQIRLNADAELTVQAVRRGGAGAASSLSLLRGEGWFRTKNPQSGLTIRTPAATAAIRGTEINVRIDPGEETVLTVVEGAAELANEAGRVVAAAGEEARAFPGQPPTKRALLTPEDAVQWVLYYPLAPAAADLPRDGLGGAGPGFDELRGGQAEAALASLVPLAPQEPWARVGAAIAHLQLDRPDAAAVVLGEDDQTAPAPWRVERFTQAAAVSLARGEAVEARRHLASALALDPEALRPLLLLASLELAQNHKDAARTATERALAAHPASVGAHVAASEVAQAFFDLPRALALVNRALELDPDDVRALVDRARLHFGSGATTRARIDAERAAGRAPGDAQVRSLLGFIRLADGDVGEAVADFRAASASAPAFGEPYLGLGLAQFRQQRPDQGLVEMLTATLLEPKVALYQSYLGKAYYQRRRFAEGLAALDTAKRLDPRDPTPWLYSSLFLRDQNRQREALDVLRQAIALNDNRAVYRSRFLLDRDEATANVSLAEVYRQMGFEAWGASEALNSLDVDLTNASAHLFLADTYGRLPDRTQALSSELLQFFLYSPVNRNTFNNFSEYAALIEQPWRQLALVPGIGSEGWWTATAATRSGNERVAHYAFIEEERQDGARPDRADRRTQAFAQAKVSLTSSSAVFASVSGVDRSRGEDNVRTQVIPLEDALPLILRTYAETRDPNVTNSIEDLEATLGFTQSWRVGSTLTSTLTYGDTTSTDENPEATVSACLGINLEPFQAKSSSWVSFPFRSLDFQAQQTTRVGRHQIIVGSEIFRQRKERRCRETIVFVPTGGTLLSLEEAVRAEDEDTRVWLRDDIALGSRAHASLGVAWNQLRYGDQATGDSLSLARWQPMAGLTLRLAPATVLRAAAFRHLASNFVGARIGPATIGGFPFQRNEYPTTVRDEADVAVEHGWTRVFVTGRAFYRETDVPLFGSEPAFLDVEEHSRGAGAAINLIVSSRVTLFADELFSRTTGTRLQRDDSLARGGLTYLDSRGVIVRFSGSYYWQKFSGTGAGHVPYSRFPTADVEATWELAGKRALLTFRATNLFDRSLSGVVPSLDVDQLWPVRRLYARLRWRF